MYRKVWFSTLIELLSMVLQKHKRKCVKLWKKKHTHTHTWKKKKRKRRKIIQDHSLCTGKRQSHSSCHNVKIFQAFWPACSPGWCTAKPKVLWEYPTFCCPTAGVHPTKLKCLRGNPIALNSPTVNEERARAMPARHLQKWSQDLGRLNRPLDLPQFTCCYHVNPGLKALRRLFQDSWKLLCRSRADWTASSGQEKSSTGWDFQEYLAVTSPRSPLKSAEYLHRLQLEKNQAITERLKCSPLMMLRFLCTHQLKDRLLCLSLNTIPAIGETERWAQRACPKGTGKL